MADDSDVVGDQTVGDLLRWAASQAPDVTALVEGLPSPEQRRRWTYAGLLEEAERTARALLGRFEPGARVAVWANNIPEWILLETGAALAGLTLATANPSLRAAELRHVLGVSRASGIFLLEEYRGNSLASALASVRDELPELREAVLSSDWAAFCSSGAASRTLPEVRPGDPAHIQYTSGTTGVPKGAVLHHRGITNSARLTYVPALGLRRGDVHVNPMPLFHTAGCVLGTVLSFASLGTQVLVPYFDPALHQSLIESERGTVFGGVPTMLIGLLNHPDSGHTDLSSVRVALSGGAVVQPSLVERVEREVGVPMCIIYGQTEACPAISMTGFGDSAQDRAETLGRPVSRIDVRIVDPSGGATTVPTGTVGRSAPAGTT